MYKKSPHLAVPVSPIYSPIGWNEHLRTRHSTPFASARKDKTSFTHTKETHSPYDAAQRLMTRARVWGGSNTHLETERRCGGKERPLWVWERGREGLNFLLFSFQGVLLHSRKKTRRRTPAVFGKRRLPLFFKWGPCHVRDGDQEVSQPNGRYFVQSAHLCLGQQTRAKGRLYVRT